MPKITRREFLLDIARAAAVVSVAPYVFSQPTPVFAAQETSPAVVVAKGNNNDTAFNILKTALDGLGGIERFVKPGQTVAIKPNATWAYAPHTASSTDPDVLRAMIQIVRDAGAKRIIVMDHCSIEPGAAEALRVSGIGDLVDEMDVEKIFIDRTNGTKDQFTEIEMPSGKAFKKISVIKAAVEADVRINMAVAKSHSVTMMTMCLKHMMGFMEVPGQLHDRLHQGIADLNSDSPIKAHLHILEAIRYRYPLAGIYTCAGPQTDITHPLRVIRANQIVAGIDPVLIDAYACINYFQFKPKELAHLKLAFDSGLGELDVDKASSDGRLKIFNVGAIAAKPTPVAAPAAQTQLETPAAGDSAPVKAAATSPAQPTPQQPVEIAAEAAETTTYNSVVNPKDFLNYTSIPAAMIVAGTGLVAARRMKKAENAQEQEIDSSDEKQ